MSNLSTTGLRMLVVDDDPCTVRLVKAAVHRYFGHEFEVVGTTKTTEAQALLAAESFDFLITDIEMPEASGFDLLRYAKQCDAWTQVIMITGHSTWDRVNAALEAGVSDYLLKPQLLDHIETVIRDGCRRLHRWRSAARGTLEAKTLAPVGASVVSSGR